MRSNQGDTEFPHVHGLKKYSAVIDAALARTWELATCRRGSHDEAVCVILRELGYGQRHGTAPRPRRRAALRLVAEGKRTEAHQANAGKGARG